MKRGYVLLVAVLVMCMTGVAWGDVIVVNSIGEPDSNRPGEDLPEWWDTDGDDLAVSTDSAGGESTHSMTIANCTEGAVYNDHYEDPIDISCCFEYFNFYVKADVEVEWLGGYGSSNDWSEEFSLPDLQDQITAVGEWNYISVSVDDMGLYGFIPADYDTNGLNWDLVEEGQIWFDHWTFSTTPEEGMLAEAEPPPPPISITGSGHRLLVGQDIDLAVDAGDIEPTAYQWSKNGAELGGETGAALSILSVTTDDTGDYSCLVTYEEEGGDAAYAEAEPHYYVWVTESALPLAGGLGLGLLAGACALAGAVSIRRKK
jgi:hypothetical protein